MAPGAAAVTSGVQVTEELHENVYLTRVGGLRGEFCMSMSEVGNTDT